MEIYATNETLEDPYAYDLPEDTEEEIADKIEALAWMIRNDWSDPRDECREICTLCNKLKAMLNNSSFEFTTQDR